MLNQCSRPTEAHISIWGQVVRWCGLYPELTIRAIALSLLMVAAALTYPVLIEEVESKAAGKMQLDLGEAVCAGQRNRVAVLLRAGADPHWSYSRPKVCYHGGGEAPLITWAARLGCLEVAEELLRFRADPNTSCWSSMHPLEWARTIKDRPMERLLRSYGAVGCARCDARRRPVPGAAAGYSAPVAATAREALDADENRDLYTGTRSPPTLSSSDQKI